LIYAGGGVILSGASEKLQEFAELLQTPVTATLMGIGCFPAVIVDAEASGSRILSGWACSECTAPTRPTWPCSTRICCWLSAHGSTTVSREDQRVRAKGKNRPHRHRSDEHQQERPRGHSIVGDCKDAVEKLIEQSQADPSRGWTRCVSHGSRKSANGKRAIGSPTRWTARSSSRNMWWKALRAVHAGCHHHHGSGTESDVGGPVFSA